MAFVVEPEGGALGGARECLDIAFVNLMPDAALVQTENQFTSLLGAGRDDLPVRLSRYTLPGVPRAQPATEYLSDHYFPIEALWASHPAALIVTGAEPRAAELSAEPYWDQLVRLLEWARDNTASTIVSCLAAHALVLAFDGVQRCALPAKHSGVFAQQVRHGNPLTDGLPAEVNMPHSRLNDVPLTSLEAAGYHPLISSTDIGWTVAGKDDGPCLFVLMQGHPEYDVTTLLLEYRRDVRRYLHKERAVYPALPVGYLSAAAQSTLAAFRDLATVGEPTPKIMEHFPFDAVTHQVASTWRTEAELLYGNWLTEVQRRVTPAEVVDAR